MYRGEYSGEVTPGSLQFSILQFIARWGKINNTPIPQRVIIMELSKQRPRRTVQESIRTLVKKGYLRKAVCTTASYVQIRTVSIYC